MKLRSQLILNNALLLGLLLVVAGTMYTTQRSLLGTAHWVDHTHEVMEHSRQLAKFMVDMETGQRGFMLTGEEQFLQPFEEGQRDFMRTLRETLDLVVDNPAQTERLLTVEALHSEWLESAGLHEIALRRMVDRGELPFEALKHVLQGRNVKGELIPANERTGKQLMDEIRLDIEAIVQVEQALLEERELANREAASASQKVAISGALFACLLGVVLGTYLIRRLTDQLGAEPDELRTIAEQVAVGVLSERIELRGSSSGQSVAAHVNSMIETFRELAARSVSIAKGNFEDVPLRSNKDELGLALRKMTTQLREVTEENERQEWINSGQTALTDVLSGEHELSALSKNAICQLARYLDAQVGALYTSIGTGEGPMDTDDSTDELMLSGRYALHHNTSVNTRIAFGEGLVGQAALEQQTIVLTDVPADYLQVESGLGAAAPSHVVVVPTMMDGHVKGVIELGSFAPFTQPQLDLLSLVAEYIAEAIHSAQIRQKMKVLLDKTQRQAGTLRMQQDELQRANRELQSHAEVLKMSEERLTQSNRELELSSAKLEKQRRNVERQKETLEKQKAELAQSNRYKSEFMSNMSHELRTPLNSILILSNSLAENENGHLDDTEVQAAKIVHSGGTELMQLINEILDLSKIEAGKMSVLVESVSLEEVLDGLSRQFKPIAAERGIEFLVSTSTAVDRLTTDEQRLGQILKNLVSNAIKFTEEGRVCLRVGAPAPDLPSPLARRAGVLALSVVDTGVGIAPDRRQAIFEAFQQADGSTSRTYGGTGLGLTISRQLANLLGGELLLESSDASGSTFTLLLPAAAPVSDVAPAGSSVTPSISPPPAAPAAAPAELAANRVRSSDVAPVSLLNRQVLLVDDCARNLFAVGQGLSAAGMLLESATNGSMALKKLQTGHFDIVLMDVMMPEMDGLTATREIRMMPQFENLPVITLTAKAMPEDREQCMRAGATAYMAKPVIISELLALMATCLAGSDHPADVGAQA
jgi:signal transduction histidine kinase/CHASE3 domain sensor protein/ActR/RegA family two-component response regulator